MSMIAGVTKAVVDELNAASFSLPFRAERFYHPELALPENKELRVAVAPKGVTREMLDRNRQKRDVEVYIAVMKKYTRGTPEEVDPLMHLAEEIGDFFTGKMLVSTPPALWVKTVHDPATAIEHMEKLRQFTSLLTVTFRIVS